MNIIRTHSDNADFRTLVALLDAELAVRDGEEHSFYAQFNKVDAIQNVVVAYAGGDHPVGCGGFKEYSPEAIEIKRMFVRPEHRGRGVAVAVLAELEKWAAKLGYREGVLETGLKQPEAIRLYEKSGYTRIPNYGQYEGVENSVCMKKVLG
jgi:GNAT superfamily N-acetyltransferase